MLCIKEQPRALRHFPLTTSKNVCIAFLQQFILCTVYFFDYYFCNRLFCSSFIDFDYLINSDYIINSDYLLLDSDYLINNDYFHKHARKITTNVEIHLALCFYRQIYSVNLQLCFQQNTSVQHDN